MQRNWNRQRYSFKFFCYFFNQFEHTYLHTENIFLLIWQYRISPLPLLAYSHKQRIVNLLILIDVEFDWTWLSMMTSEIFFCYHNWMWKATEGTWKVPMYCFRMKTIKNILKIKSPKAVIRISLRNGKFQTWIIKASNVHRSSINR